MMSNERSTDERSTDEPRVLIVSNNALSQTNNNGKTLASFFKNFNPNNIAQLYFNSEIPTRTEASHYFQITDQDIIKSIISPRYICGRAVVRSCDENKVNKKSENLNTKLGKNSLARLLRELGWKLGKWDSNHLTSWLDKISPDIIFFCAGDSAFSYDIVNYIQKRFNTKLITYITDDYVLPRKTLNFCWWIRRNYVLGKMRKTVASSDEFITISSKMKEIYKDFLQKDSVVAVNMSDTLMDETKKTEINSYINIVYTGGLHFNRYRTLELLGKSIKRYNSILSEFDKIVYLKIYSNRVPAPSILQRINIEGASEYCGSLNPKELKDVLNTADIPVHVESFDKKSVESTRLSISTKIPEYLSLGKPILAIGPKEVASMEYLHDVSFCITEPNDILRKLTIFLKDNNLQMSLSRKATSYYNEFHNPDKMGGLIYRVIMDLDVCNINDKA